MEKILAKFGGDDEARRKELADALQELAYEPSERGTDDAEPLNTAEAVAYGEKVERERKDREDERKGEEKTAKAMDARAPAHPAAYRRAAGRSVRMSARSA